MNYRIILLMTLLGSLSATCGSKSDMVESETGESTIEMNQYQDNSSTFKSVVLESRATLAGVQSNLKGTRKYELRFGAVISEPIEFKRLLVDSVAIPLSALVVNGQKQKTFELTESSEIAQITAYRSIYSNDPNVPQMVEPQIYEKTGLALGDKAVVEYTKEGKPYYLEIPKITLLQNIYAP